MAPTAQWMEDYFSEVGVADDLRFDAQVCLEEALANLIMHGRARADAKAITVDVEAHPAGIRLRICDNCQPFDVSDHQLTEASAEKAKIGGKGLMLMQKIAGRLDYEAGEASNLLSMSFGSWDAVAARMATVPRVPVFSSMTEPALRRLAECAEAVDYTAGDMLVSQGTTSPFAIILVEGKVDILVEGGHGETIVGAISAPALVGEIGALADLPRTAGVRAASDVRSLHVPRESLFEVAHETDNLLPAVIRQLGGQIRNINQVLALYAAGFEALERDDFDPSLIDDLSHPGVAMSSFQSAFRRLADHVLRERRTREEMASAAIIQRAMLPVPIEPERLAGKVELFGSMRAARDVGGDLFDHILLEDGRIALVIGDVCGKGVPASLFMSATVTALRIAVQTHSDDLGALIRLVNETLCAENRSSMFTTLIYAILDPGNGRLDYVVCGHNRPLLFGSGEKVKELEGRGPPLGLFPDKGWTENHVILERGQSVLFYTDGVTEAMNEQKEEFGEERLMEVVRGGSALPVGDLVMAVDMEVTQFAGMMEQSDDVTYLAVRRL